MGYLELAARKGRAEDLCWVREPWSGKPGQLFRNQNSAPASPPKGQSSPGRAPATVSEGSCRVWQGAVVGGAHPAQVHWGRTPLPLTRLPLPPSSQE